MKHTLRTLSIIGVLLFSSQSPAAVEKKCVGDKKMNSVVFSGDESGDGNLAIRRSVDGSTQPEILDDTGYVSALLAVNYLVRDSEPSKAIASAERSQTIRFIRLRLAKFKKALEGGIPSDSPTMKSIADLDRILNRSSISVDNLKQAWTGLVSALYSDKVHVSARTREPGTNTWDSTEKPLSDFDLPSFLVIRGISCMPSVSEVKLGDAINASISKQASGNRQDIDLSNAAIGSGNRQDLEAIVEALKKTKGKK